MTRIKGIAMLSVHGYFDPEPILGATDTGGQVTYVLELSKHLAETETTDFVREIGTERIVPRKPDHAAGE